MKYVLIMLGLAAVFSSLFVNVILYARVLSVTEEKAEIRQLALELYEVALEQNNALNSAVGDLEELAHCQRQLEKCQGIR